MVLECYNTYIGEFFVSSKPLSSDIGFINGSKLSMEMSQNTIKKILYSPKG